MLKTVSVLRPQQWLPVPRIDAMHKAAIRKLTEIAQNDLPGMSLTIRDLLPSDLPGLTNNEFVETSGTDNAWGTTTMGNGGSINNETFIAITGLAILTPRAHNADHVVTAMKFTIGASTVAQVSLYNISPIINSGTAAGEVVGSPATLAGFLETPIIVRANQTVTIDEYTTTGATEYLPVVIGYVAEKSGKAIATS